MKLQINYLLAFLIIIIAVEILTSCSHTKLTQTCSVEVNETISDPCGSGETNIISLESCRVFDTICINENQCEFIFKSTCGKLFKVFCDNNNPSRNPVLLTQADPDEPPLRTFLICPCHDTDTCCCRDRNDFLTHIAIGLGYRQVNLNEDTYYFYNSNGELINKNKPEQIIPVLDAYFMLSMDKDDYSKSGLHIGAMYAEEYLFFPVGYHFRYIFNPHPDPHCFDCGEYDIWHCLSGYLFADAGIPFDFKTGAPILNFYDFPKYQRYFLDFGTGLLINMGFADLSIDAALRFMNLPLGEIVCCPNLSDKYRYAFRRTALPFARIGLLF